MPESEIYSPSDDSYLLSDTLKNKIKDKDIKCLEIGIGSGIQLQTLKDIGIKKILGGDINSNSVNHCKKLGFQCKKSNLFKNIQGKFDLIIFNPPYLPRDAEKKEPKESRLATTGGKKGSEIINKFIKQAKKYLNKNGKIILLTSSLTKGINWLDYKKKLFARKKLFFEELYVLELSLKPYK